MRRILTVATAALLLAACSDDDEADSVADVAPVSATDVPPVPTQATGSTTPPTFGPAADDGDDDSGAVDPDLSVDTAALEVLDADDADFCALNDRFSALLAGFFTSSDPERAWRDVEDQLQEVLDALPAELRDGADTGRAYYDALEEHFEQNDWDIAAALEQPPALPPEVEAYEARIGEYTEENC